MTTKELKYLNVIKDFFAVPDAVKNENGWRKVMQSALEFDYGTAVLLWEYALGEVDSKMSGEEYARVYADVTESLFESRNASKFAKTLTESAAIRTAIYRYSRTAFTRKETVGYLSALLVSGKIDDADEIVKCAMRNVASKATFGKLILDATSRTIIELVKKNTGKSVMSRKLASFLNDAAKNIKTGEGAVIIQRIKELS